MLRTLLSNIFTTYLRTSLSNSWTTWIRTFWPWTMIISSATRTSRTSCSTSYVEIFSASRGNHLWIWLNRRNMFRFSVRTYSLVSRNNREKCLLRCSRRLSPNLVDLSSRRTLGVIVPSLASSTWLTLLNRYSFTSLLIRWNHCTTQSQLVTLKNPKFMLSERSSPTSLTTLMATSFRSTWNYWPISSRKWWN